MTSTQNEKSHTDRSEMRDCRGSGQTRWLAAGGPTVGIGFAFKLCQCAVPRVLMCKIKNKSCHVALMLQITPFEQASGATSDIQKSQFTKKNIKQFSGKKRKNRGESIAN